jgi:hypothetical protein
MGVEVKVDDKALDPIIYGVMRRIKGAGPRIARLTANRVARRIKDRATDNLSGRVWNGGPYAIRRFHVKLAKGSARGTVLGTASAVEAVIECTTTDPVSAIMEFGVDHPWTILPRGISGKWRGRRKYRDTRGKTRTGAFALLINGRLVKKAERKGLKRRPWMSDAIASVSKSDIEEDFYDALWRGYRGKYVTEVESEI